MKQESLQMAISSVVASPLSSTLNAHRKASSSKPLDVQEV